jgi:hypothetical protein
MDLDTHLDVTKGYILSLRSGRRCRQFTELSSGLGTLLIDTLDRRHTGPTTPRHTGIVVHDLSRLSRSQVLVWKQVDCIHRLSRVINEDADYWQTLRGYFRRKATGLFEYI